VTQTRYTGGWPSIVEPYQGWTLHEFDEEDGEGFTTTAYFARGPKVDVGLNLSRFNFEPTDARFCWLVDNNFGQGFSRGGPLTNDDIDARIAREVSVSYLMASAAADVAGRILAGASL
jgi:hypothetical protein